MSTTTDDGILGSADDRLPPVPEVPTELALTIWAAVSGIAGFAGQALLASRLSARAAETISLAGLGPALALVVAAVLTAPLLV